MMTVRLVFIDIALQIEVYIAGQVIDSRGSR